MPSRSRQVFEAHCAAMKRHLEMVAAAASDVRAALKSENEALQSLGGAVMKLSDKGDMRDKKVDLCLELLVAAATTKGGPSASATPLPPELLARVRDVLPPERLASLGVASGVGEGVELGPGSESYDGRAGKRLKAASGAAAAAAGGGVETQGSTYIPSLLTNFDGEGGVTALWCAQHTTSKGMRMCTLQRFVQLCSVSHASLCGGLLNDQSLCVAPIIGCVRRRAEWTVGSAHAPAQARRGLKWLIENKTSDESRAWRRTTQVCSASCIFVVPLPWRTTFLRSLLESQKCDESHAFHLDSSLRR